MSNFLYQKALHLLLAALIAHTLTGCGTARHGDISLSGPLGLPADRYDWLNKAVGCYNESTKTDEYDKEVRRTWASTAEYSYSHWKEMSIMPTLKEIEDLRCPGKIIYYRRFKDYLDEYPNHPYRKDMERAVKELEYLRPQSGNNNRSEKPEYTPSRIRDKSKQYINLTLPSGSQFCPLATVHENRLVVARIIPSTDGRNIAVIRREGKRWLPLGDREDVFTEKRKGYVFLGDMRVSPDETLWVLSVYTMPRQTYLYRYEDGKWIVEGPPKGNRLNDTLIWDSGLHFLGKNAPCHIFETQDEGVQILSFDGSGWHEAPVSSEVRKMIRCSTYVWTVDIARRKKDIWMVWTEDIAGKQVLRTACLTSPRRGGLKGPFDLMEIDRNLSVQSTAVSSAGVIAVNLTDGNFMQKNGNVYLFRRHDDNQFNADKCPPPLKDSRCMDLAWSEDGILFAAYAINGNSVELLGLKNDKWISLYRRHQPSDEGRIGKTRIFFHPSGEACVVWADNY